MPDSLKASLSAEETYKVVGSEGAAQVADPLLQEKLFEQSEMPDPPLGSGRIIKRSELKEFSASGLDAELATCQWLLAQGDTFDLLAELPAESVDLIVTSPPYWGHRSYGQEHNWKIIDAWRSEGHSDQETPPYEWYRDHGGILGLEPIPDWFTQHLLSVTM